MRHQLTGFATLSEFIAGQNGDCGPTATLAALHAIDPTRWPLDRAGLAALDADEESHGFAERNGAQNIVSLANYLDHIGQRHTTYGYGVCPLETVHATLKTLSGVKPLIIEWANAGALPGDEPAVHFHFSTCGGIDTGPHDDGVGGGYLFCDGDNRADDPQGAPRPPLLYTWANIVAAQPIAMVIVEPPATGPAASSWRILPDGSATDDSGNHVGLGFAARIQADHITTAAYLSETYLPTGFDYRSFCPLRDGSVLLWDGRQVTRDGGAALLTALWLHLAAQRITPPDPNALAWQTFGRQLKSLLDKEALA